MKRPHSAKPGYRANNWNPNTQQGEYQQSDQNKNNPRKNIKIMKPDLTTNDFARILPKKIYQDKERLYSETLQLKQTLNQTIQENIRLKTRISILQKQKDKLTKHIDFGREGHQSKNNINSRINVYNNKSGEKENMIVQNLKKMVRESKEENEYLKQENAKIKKAIKYTKINELEIQRKMLQDENKRVVALLEEMNQQLSDQDRYEREIGSLKRMLEDQEDANKELNEANMKYIEYIEELQEKLNSETQKHQAKQNKLQRDLALNKRKMSEALKRSEDLRKQLQQLKDQNNISQIQKKQKLVRPTSSNPNKDKNIVGVRLANDNTKKQIDNKQNQENIKIIQSENEKLKEELNRTKIKLEQTERKFIEEREKSKSVISNFSNNQQKQQKQQDEKNKSKVQQKQQQKSPAKKVMESKNNNDYEDDYDNEYDEFEQPQAIMKKSKVKKQQASEIDQYRKDFEAEEDQEQLFVKKQQQSKTPKKDSNDKKKSKNAYKPDKKTLSEIKQLLTYRMKAQRYPFSELKKDIEEAKQKKFSFNQLTQMLSSEPFYLTKNYIECFLKYCYEKQQKQKIPLTSTITHETLLAKLRKVIEDFVLLDEKQEEEMLLRIAEMVTEYPEELQAAFDKIKNGQDTVCKQKFIEMFKRLQLQDRYIEIIIQQLSLCSTDLQHLNFHGFFQRFYVQNLQYDNGRIDEEQMESSRESEGRSRVMRAKQSRGVDKNRQFEEDDDDLVMDEGERISLGDEKYDGNEIVSDDGMS